MKIIGKILYLFKNSPEEFAKKISIENGLGNESLIAMQIRRQIHEYVLNLLKTVSNRIINSEKEIKSKNRNRNRSHQKKGEVNWYQQRAIEKIISEPDLLEPSLSEQLGKKRNRNFLI